jgi:hypothetical protein
MAESGCLLQAVLPFRPEQAMMQPRIITLISNPRQAGFPDENSFFRLKP